MHRDTTTTTNRKEKKRLENRVVVVVETLRRWDLEVKPLIEAKNRKEKENVILVVVFELLLNSTAPILLLSISSKNLVT